MARILVTGDIHGIAARTLLERLVEQIREDGHDAALAAEVEDPAQEVRDADAVVAILDTHGHADAAALIAFAHANRKPALGVVSRGAVLPRFVRSLCTQVAEVRRGAEIRPALQSFYERVRPFAGRLVRDGVPKLVEQAGHSVQFRQVGQEDLPRFLKRKIAEEAQALDQAAGGQEKEEMADLLEALEAFIAVRGMDRDELKRVKAHKKEQRGGFEVGFVVESASTSESGQKVASPTSSAGGRAAEAPATSRRTAPERTSADPPGAAQRASSPPTATQPTGGQGRSRYDGPVWEADDAVPVDQVTKEPEPAKRDASSKVWDI